MLTRFFVRIELNSIFSGNNRRNMLNNLKKRNLSIFALNLSLARLKKLLIAQKLDGISKSNANVFLSILKLGCLILFDL